MIAAGQTYFAIRTREAELTEEALAQGMGADQLRLYVRSRLTDYNKQLASAAYDAGVLTQQDFGVFQDHGYRGLYAGEAAADIHLRKGLKKGQRILDWMGSDELAANLFRASQTEQKLRNDPTITDNDRARRRAPQDGRRRGSSSSSRATHRQSNCRHQQRVSPSYSVVSRKRLAAAEHAVAPAVRSSMTLAMRMLLEVLTSRVASASIAIAVRDDRQHDV